MTVRAASAMLLSLLLIGCNHNRYPQNVQVLAKPTLVGNHHIGYIKVGRGIACYLDGNIGPPSYSVRDIGKDHVPRPHPSDMAMLHRIMKYAHPRTLRFTYLYSTFVVFNAPRSQLCNLDVPPFAMWNGACNEYYSQINMETVAVMDCSYPPRPWIKGDKGTGTGSWANIMH